MSAKHILGALLCAGALLTGCGSDEEGEQLPGDSAQQLDAQLQFIQRALDEGSAAACRTILEGSPRSEPNRTAVQRVLAGLPDDVDPDLRNATDESFNRLFELVEQECDDREQAEEETETDTQTETTPTVTETVPAETETTPPETETTPPEPPQEQPGNGNGNGNGNDGGGNGNDGGGQPAPGRE